MAGRSKQSRLDGLAFHTLPQGYRENSSKEEAVLEYVENFRRQFVQLFPLRRELFLCPLNECGVRVRGAARARAARVGKGELFCIALGGRGCRFV